METKINWPNGKKFAFTIFDDTDLTTIQNGPEIYQFLCELGMLTTKSVWPIKGLNKPRIGGTTCADFEYLKWIDKLKLQGFEIALHNITYHTSTRAQIVNGMEQFKKYFGEYPKIQVNHADCQDAVYWGDARLSGIYKLLYNLLTRFKNYHKFYGDIDSTQFFWGDILKQYVKYVRNFVYHDINTLKACPYMPYFDKDRPLVNYWFASSMGANCKSFCDTVSEKNQDRLEEEGGACIMYTHFGANDFYQHGKLNKGFKQLMHRLSNKNGWFVPVSTLLDYIQQEKGHHTITINERSQLECKWIMEKIFIDRGTS